MDRQKVIYTIQEGMIEWQTHALERMMKRGISREIVKQVLMNGEIIEEYPDDQPFPTALFLGRVVITVYRPDLDHFESDYKTRR